VEKPKRTTPKFKRGHWGLNEAIAHRPEGLCYCHVPIIGKHSGRNS